MCNKYSNCATSETLWYNVLLNLSMTSYWQLLGFIRSIFSTWTIKWLILQYVHLFLLLQPRSKGSYFFWSIAFKPTTVNTGSLLELKWSSSRHSEEPDSTDGNDTISQTVITKQWKSSIWKLLETHFPALIHWFAQFNCGWNVQTFYYKFWKK